MMSCDNRNRTPAVCVSCAPANRTDASRSTGTPSIDDDEFDSCSGVASALERYFNPLAAELAMSLAGECRGDRVGICAEGDHNFDEYNEKESPWIFDVQLASDCKEDLVASIHKLGLDCCSCKAAAI